MGGGPFLWTFIYRIFCCLTLGEKSVILRRVPVSHCVCLHLLPADTDADSVSSIPGSEGHVLAINELL